jgi:glycosyltransferase AglD
MIRGLPLVPRRRTGILRRPMVSGLWKRLRALAVPPEESTGHRRALRLLGLAVVAAFALFAASHVDLRRVGASLATANPWLLLHAFRWAAVVRPKGVRVRAADVFAAMTAGFAVGIAVPARAGDLVRSHLLARRAGLRRSFVLASAGVDYLVGTASLVPLVALLALATPLPGWARDALLVLSVASGAGVIALFVLRPRRDVAADAHGLAGLVQRLRAGLSVAHEPWALARSLGWSVLGWGAELAVAWLTLAAVGIPPTLALAALATLATAAANAIAVSPGNAGPFELAAMIPLAGLGIAREPALAFAILFHLAHLVPIAAIGGWVLVREAGAPLRADGEPR